MNNQVPENRGEAMSKRGEFDTWFNALVEGIEAGAPNTLSSVRFSREVMWEAWQAARANPVAPDGWQLVPVEPTPKMVDATWDHPIDKNGGIESQNARNVRIYRAMLAAAPAPGDK
jgi:hypothetical protein